MIGISILTKEMPESSLIPFTTCRPSEKLAGYKPEEGSHQNPTVLSL